MSERVRLRIGDSTILPKIIEGISPDVELTQQTEGVMMTVTTKSGTKSALIPRGPKGDDGDKGDKGDAFTYADFTEIQKAELIQGPIQTAQTNAVTAVNEAGTSQVAAVEAKGNQVIDSIPSDYSELTEDVNSLKSAFIEIDSALYDTTYNKPLERVPAEKNASNYWVAYIPISNLVAHKTYILYSKDIESGTYTLLYYDSSYNDHGSAGNVVFSDHYATFSVVPNSRDIYVRLVFGNSSSYSDASCVVYEPNSDGVFHAIDLAKQINKYNGVSFQNESGKGFLNSSGDITSTTSEYYVTQPITVVPGEVYRIRSSEIGPVAYHYAYYDGTTKKDMGPAGSGAEATMTFDAVITIPSGVNKLRVCYYGESMCIISKATQETTQKAIDDIRDELDIKLFDPLYGKTLIGLGDSLMSTYYCGEGKDWLHLIGARHNMTVYNHAISGNPISGTDNCMAVRYASMEDADDAYIIVMGGANDYNNNTPIGENTDNTTSTFKGALNVLINGLISKYPTGKIVFCTNYRRANTADEKKYVDAMLEICALYSVPCHNNYDSSNVYFFNHDWMDEYGAEAGVYTNRHLNAAGDARVSTMYEAILSKL